MKTIFFRIMRLALFLLPLLGRGLGGGCVLFAQDLSVCYGKGYTLTSTAAAPATGATPVTYQWYEDDILLTGKNEASLIVAVGKAAGEYKYVRVAANAECPEGRPSNTFTVRVHALPTVTASAAASACADAAVDFTAAAGGGTTTAMTYTWTIAGATASTTTTTYRRTLSTTGSNTYSVTVRNSNGCVSAASPAKTITINGPAGAGQSSACGCTTGLANCFGTCQASCGMVSWTTCGFTAVTNTSADDMKYKKWDVAAAYCASKGGRLPTVAELLCMCANKSAMPGSYAACVYWSSSPAGAGRYAIVNFVSYDSPLCYEGNEAENMEKCVRCIK